MELIINMIPVQIYDIIVILQFCEITFYVYNIVYSRQITT